MIVVTINDVTPPSFIEHQDVYTFETRGGTVEVSATDKYGDYYEIEVDGELS